MSNAKKPQLNVAQRAHDLFMGKLITIDVVKKYWKEAFLALVLIMTFIATKYQCMTSMERIAHMQDTLNIKQSECIREQSTFRSRCRESSMQAMVDSLLPGLAVQEQPPFRIKK